MKAGRQGHMERGANDEMLQGRSVHSGPPSQSTGGRQYKYMHSRWQVHTSPWSEQTASAITRRWYFLCDRGPDPQEWGWRECKITGSSIIIFLFMVLDDVQQIWERFALSWDPLSELWCCSRDRHLFLSFFSANTGVSFSPAHTSCKCGTNFDDTALVFVANVSQELNTFQLMQIIRCKFCDGKIRIAFANQAWWSF